MASAVCLMADRTEPVSSCCHLNSLAESGFLAEALRTWLGTKVSKTLGHKFLWNDGSVFAFCLLSKLASESGEAQID